MANIICIETSGRTCSVALSVGGVCTACREFTPDACGQMEHSALLAPFIDEILTEHNCDFDAVAVSAGPGSYTGLRIGFATAKGLCFGGGKPLILIDSLVCLVQQIIDYAANLEPDMLLIPMVDARRMEIYTATYTIQGKRLTDIAPVIVTPTTFEEYAGSQIVVFGSGAVKCMDFLAAAGVDATYVEIEHSAKSMCAVAQDMFAAQDFADIAYSEPLYLKEFVGGGGR